MRRLKARAVFGTCFGVLAGALVAIAMLVAAGVSRPMAAEPQSAAAMSTVEALGLEIEQLHAAVKRDDLDEARLGPIRDRATEILLQANRIETELAPDVEAARKRLRELTPGKDKDGAAIAESDEIRAARQRQERELAQLQGAFKQANLIKLKAQEVIGTAIDKRRSIFSRKLLAPSYSLFNPSLWVEATEQFGKILVSLRLLISDWFNLLTLHGRVAVPVLIGVALFLGLLLLSPVRRWLVKGARRGARTAPPSPLNKVSAATWIILINVGLPTGVIFVLGTFLQEMELLPDRIRAAFITLFMSLGGFGLIFGLSRAILAPTRPQWRLARLDDDFAERLYWIIVAIGAVHSATVLLTGMQKILVAPVSLTVATAGVSSLVIALATLFGLRTATRGLIEYRRGREGLARSIWSLFLPVWWIAALVIIGAVLGGYIALGWFLATQIVWASSVLAALGVFLMLTDAVFSASFDPHTRFGMTLIESMGFSERGVRQVGVILSGVVRLLLLVLAAVLLLAPWGFESSDLLGSARLILSGITVGGITLSPMVILVAVAIFIVGVTMTRAIQRWLDDKFLPETSIDTGLKNSIVTSFGYVGVIAATMLTVAHLGVDLGNIAIVAGALSVGIGFGLQSIVNNFVSGLILLAERPIKTGDWVVVGSEQGYVKRINVRATEIETFDRATVIVPNSELISGVVKNWMHTDTVGRIRVAVGVGYESDPDQVLEILLRCAGKHPMVLDHPPPKAYFLEFGASSLDFELRCYLANIDYSLTVSSALRLEIFRALNAAGIEIPFPQRDIHIRDIARVEAIAEMARAPGGSGPERKARRQMPEGDAPARGGPVRSGAGSEGEER